MVDSQRVGAEKPDPAIFQAALTELQAKRETTVMVGDSLRRDYEGARRSGIGFIWIAPEGVQATQRDGAENRSVLASVTELPDLLDPDMTGVQESLVLRGVSSPPATGLACAPTAIASASR